MEEENVCAQLYVKLYLKHHDGSIKLSALTTQSSNTCHNGGRSKFSDTWGTVKRPGTEGQKTKCNTINDNLRIAPSVRFLV